jgi:hypothetical protein
VDFPKANTEMSKRFWMIWSLCDVAWLLGLPLVFGLWLGGEVHAEYLSGARVSTDGDSISIPIFGVAIFNTILIMGASLVLGVYVYLKRRRTS